MPSIYIYKYNNYYNRQVKSETSLSNYGTAIYIETNVNFNPNDDVNAQQLVGRLNNWYTGDGDYFIYSEDGQNITSRWFILDATRLRQGQYLVTLRRDVVVDNYNDIIEAPMFIEKGYVQDSNPLIFNNENMGYNQIKTSEILLENKLKTPWVVCYLSRYHTAENGSYEYNEFSGSFTDEGATVADYELSSLSSYKYYYWSTYKDGNKTAAEYRWSDNIDFSTYYNLLNPDGTKKGQYRWRITSAGKGASDYQGSSSSTANFLSRVGQPSDPNAKQHWQNMYNSYLQSYTTNNGLPFNSVSGLGTANGYNELQAENGKIIKVGDKYYRINDKVIQLVNDVDNNVFNGDIGYITDIRNIDRKTYVDIDYIGNKVTYTMSDSDKFNLAYAVSVHKSQGSEYDNVVVVLAKSFSRMFYNKLLYTAVTRAKKSLIILGSIDSFNKSVKTLYATDRNTLMKNV